LLNTFFSKKKTGLVILFLLGIVMVSPILKNINYEGTLDWDQHFFYNGVPAKTIINYKQIPLWNPHYCGGNLLLAHPESAFLSPMFIIILLFGEVVGLKLQIIIHLLFGLFGMFLLAKHYKLGFFSRYLLPVIFLFSSVFTAHTFSGVTMWLTMAFFPYAFLFYLKSLEQRKYVLISAIFIALIFLGGATYPFMIFSLFLGCFSVFEAIFRKKIQPITNLIIIFLLFVLLVSIKLVPEINFLKEIGANENTLKRPGNAGYSPTQFFDTLISQPTKIDSGSYYEIINGIKYAWYDNTQYITLLGFICALGGIIISLKNHKNHSLCIVLIIFVILSFGEIKLFNLWGLLHKLPFFGSMNAPPRVNMIIVFVLAIFAGEAASFLEKKKNKLFQAITIIIILIIALNLVFVNNKIFQQTFTKEPTKMISETNFYQVIERDISKLNPYTGWSNLAYPYFLENSGIINCYEKVLLPTNVKGITDLDYKGEAYLSGDETIESYEWSPNKIKVISKESTDNELIINQNPHSGWKKYNKKNVKVQYFLPKDFLIGSLISIITIFIIIINTRKKYYK